MRWSPLVLLLLTAHAYASDSDSGDSSGDSSGASGDSSNASGESADASGQSADSSNGSGDSSGESSANSLEDSSAESTNTESTVVLSVTGSGSSTTAGGIVLTVLLVKHANKDDEVKEGSEAQDLLRAGLVAWRRDVGLLLDSLTTSPALWSALDAEVTEGSGPQLAAVSRTLRAPPGEVARAFWEAGEMPRDEAGAARFAVQFLRGVAPAMDDDPFQAGGFLAQLVRERHDPAFPAQAPAHRTLARWMGVPEAVVVEATAELPPDRGELYSAALPTLDGLADGIALRDPAAVDARIATLTGRFAAASSGGASPPRPPTTRAP